MNLQENFIEKKAHGLLVSENPQMNLSSNFYCVHPKKIDTNPLTHESRNGKYKVDAANNLDCNPKTKMNPILPPRITDLDIWRNNNMTTHSHINETTNFDNFNSGYTVSQKDSGEKIYKSEKIRFFW